MEYGERKMYDKSYKKEKYFSNQAKNKRIPFRS